MNSPNSSAALHVDFQPELVALDSDDLELELDTSLDTAPFAASKSATREESFVGTLPREPESVEESVRNRHEALALAIGDLEKVCESFDSVDVSAQAAETSLRRRVGSLSLLCNALGAVAVHVERADYAEMFAGDGTLAPYLAGVYLWAGDVTETLGTLARDLNGLTPNWSAFRERLDDVAWIRDMAMTEQGRLDRIVDAMPEDLRDSLDELFIAFVGFQHKLAEPFG